MSSRRSRQRLWFFAAIIAPLIIVGGLLGAGANGDTALERIPVALVNNDELIIGTNDDGDETFLLASRPVITELVTNDDLALNWVITSSTRANDMLERGEVYAIVEIPENFSAAVSTLDSTSPEQARFTIRTNPSRSYLAGVLAEALGQSLAQTISDEFGKEITRGFVSVIVDLGNAFGTAAEAAREVADGTQTLTEGVRELGDGVTELRSGTTDLASGYGEFDDGLGAFASGITSLSQGITTFEAGTRGLTALSTGVKDYTTGVQGVSAGLQGFNAAGAFDGITGDAGVQLQALLGGLSALATSGPTLATQTDQAIIGVRSGLVETEKGARALASAGGELRSGSTDIRNGIDELAEGVASLDDGVTELVDGVEELNAGMTEFAEGLESGAAEFEAQGITDPTDALLAALTSPVLFESQGTDNDPGLQATLASVLIPIGLWLVSLVYFVMTPPLTARIWGSTASTSRLIGRSLRPVLSVVLGQIVVVTGLFHTLGAVAWSLLPLTIVVIGLSAMSFSAVHYLLWMWKPRWLAPISLSLAIAQVVTVGAVIPVEVLPAAYQALAGLTPVAWSTDALLVIISSAGTGRLVSNALLLAVSFAAALVISGFIARGRRVSAVRADLGVGTAPGH